MAIGIGPGDDKPFADMTDGMVLEMARANLRLEAALPPASLSRLAAGQQFDRAMAELDRRALDYAVARIEQRLDKFGDGKP